MPQITARKRSNGLPVNLEASDDGALYAELDADLAGGRAGGSTDGADHQVHVGEWKALTIATNASGAIVGQCENTGFMDQTTAQQRWVYPFVSAAVSPLFSVTPVGNAALVLNTLNADLTGGNAATTLNLRVWTRQIDLTWASL